MSKIPLGDIKNVMQNTNNLYKEIIVLNAYLASNEQTYRNVTIQIRHSCMVLLI